MDINEERNKRKKQTGEYFTPEWQVRKMINKIPEEIWKNPSKTVLEPSCGDGNFVVQIIQKKVECGSTVEQAIKTTYAIDLMEDNVMETRKRVKGIILELGGSKDLFPIVDIHIKCADALKIDMDELFPDSEHEALFNNKPILMLSFGMEGGGEHIFLEPTKDGFRFRKEFSYMQLDIDDWKTGEEIIPSLKSYWEKFTNDPKWFRYQPQIVHKDCRSMVIQSLQKINLKEITPSESDCIDNWVEVLMEGKYISESPFKNQCRFHQSQYRSKVLGVWFDEDINILRIEDGKAGLNFYDGFGIRQLVKKIPFRKPFHSNLLRSEHLPYNLFIPLNQDKEFCKQAINDFLGSTFIDRILNDVVIEYAPQPKGNYLDDHTSFDVYIEYQHSDGSLGILGIEVKYTEGSYPLKKGSTEYNRLYEKFNKSKYKEITERSGKFHLKDGDFDQLKLDRYRQVWRNHLLGESIILKDGDEFNHFHSLTFYPSGNIHFTEVISEYKERFLKPEYQYRVQGITYEDFFQSCRKYCPNKLYGDWIEYLEKRYIVL